MHWHSSARGHPAHASGGARKVFRCTAVLEGSVGEDARTALWEFAMRVALKPNGMQISSGPVLCGGLQKGAGHSPRPQGARSPGR